MSESFEDRATRYIYEIWTERWGAFLVLSAGAVFVKVDDLLWRNIRSQEILNDVEVANNMAVMDMIYSQGWALY